MKIRSLSESELLVIKEAKDNNWPFWEDGFPVPDPAELAKFFPDPDPDPWGVAGDKEFEDD
jgi:hypothetical protein